MKRTMIFSCSIHVQSVKVALEQFRKVVNQL